MEKTEMDIKTATAITEIRTILKNREENWAEMREDIKSIREACVTSNDFARLELRVEKIESNIGRIVWLVLSIVIGAVLTLVLK